ncbi:MAG: sigma-70 family RNA polymerase sigma factor [Ardenticatenaceae bacterium]|nr:sigma-70 family RNA polymerase sigma factor [Anaerolineales bacterium]MCB8921160.1 sigma-70 family RNA polymerase sigma factor [Ardenticatenaceae bacterium]MCB9004441.1 sigma-70 family RNA polymerase sigma factor [Ardenticatenaceae bacterium]
MLTEDKALAQAHIIQLVTQYLLGQGWQLVDPVEFGERIWQLAREKGVQSETAVHNIQTIVWQQYAIILHDACLQPENRSQYQQAWAELSDWLHKQVHQITSHPQEQQDAVQETLIKLQTTLQTIRIPHTMWAYLLQILRRTQIDVHRRDTAKKRGEGKAFSLEQLTNSDESGRDWEETLTTHNSSRHTEGIMANYETRKQLQTFFRRHLPTELQRQVAEAHFLDDLSPKEIASLMGKRSHEIRLLKARIISKLRDLPPPAYQELMTILDEEGSGNHV